MTLFNRYGPTEATVVAAIYEITRPVAASDAIPIGTAHPGVQLFGFGERSVTGSGSSGAT